jgi:hypothetical protein
VGSETEEVIKKGTKMKRVSACRGIKHVVEEDAVKIKEEEDSIGVWLLDGGEGGGDV